MKPVKYSPLAQNDISDIWDYTFDHWGLKQATIYVQTLRDSSHALSTGSVIGRAVDIREGYFKYPAGEHFIFYKETDSEITVIRILHKSMDVGRHL
ncbi:type II toxin-antitoxin system RelE/ParE family toxin [Litorimonas sp.]|uniref:type II toxin-antitoxin system RelE/ParE family toxin n=1 Tax=Litorimonas sp. TaxID=1892381 RepID=UPI003A84C7E9